MATQELRRWGKRVRKAATATGVVSGGTLLTTLGMAYYVVRTLTGPSRPGPLDSYVLTPFETGAEFEAVTFAPEHGAHTLQGWWFPHPDTRRVVIGCPGYRGTKSDLIGIATALWRAGSNVLIFDFHGHGTGRGVPVTLAYREMQDFFGALSYVHSKVPNAQIGVIGYSMGASIAIMGAARRADVRAVVADSPFSSHADIVAYRISRTLRVNGRPIAAVADYLLPHVAGYHASDVSPMREVAAIAPRPLLIIHGTADTAIPVEHAEQIFAAAGEPKELWLGEGAEHCGTYFLDRPAYCERVTEFFARHLDDAYDCTPQTPITRAEVTARPRLGTNN